jgi:hypothetical protein
MLPSVADINVYDSLDEQVAVRHLAGKTLDEAEALFRDNALRYQEDLIFMGPVAFRFYVPAYVNYLRSAASSGDPDAVNCFVSLARHRWEFEPEELKPVRELLVGACRTVLAEWDRFGVDETIYCGWGERGLRGDYETLIASLAGASSGR